LSPAHRALLGDAVGALREDIELLVLREQLDLDAFARLAPGLGDQMLFQPVQPSLRRSDQILHGRVTGPHFGQHSLGRHAAIHHPDPPRLAVLRLDLAQEHPQRLAVGGVARQHFVSQRQALGRDNERDHELRTVGPLVAAVAMSTLRPLGQIGRVHFEIRAGQIVQQHVEIGVEQVAPALRQMRKQRVLVREQEVVAGIELVRLGQAEVRADEIGHRAVAEPFPMQPPLAARRDQPVGDQHLEHMIPSRPLAARGQALGPEPVELQLPPQQPGQPTGAPLPRAMQAHLGKPQPHHRGVVSRGFAAILREQRERSRAAGLRVEHLDRLAPSFRLRRVDLAQIINVPLHHSAIVETLVLDDVPIEVRLAVLPSFDSSQEHDDGFNHKRAPLGIGVKLSWSSLQPFSTLFPVRRPFEINYLARPKNRKIAFSNYESAKTG
jgi:hypothetical protein